MQGVVAQRQHRSQKPALLTAPCMEQNKQAPDRPCFLLQSCPTLSKCLRSWELSCAGQMVWPSLTSVPAAQRVQGGSVVGGAGPRWP